MGDKIRKTIALLVVMTTLCFFVPQIHCKITGCETTLAYFDKGNAMYSSCNLSNDSGKPTIEKSVAWTPTIVPNPNPGSTFVIANDEKVALFDKESLNMKWEQKLQGSKFSVSSDFYGVYVPTNSGIYGILRHEGENIWKSDFVSACPPLLNESRLVFCNNDGRLIQIQTGAGSYEWSLVIDAHPATPCIIDDFVYCISKNGDIHKVSDRGKDKIIGNVPNVSSSVLVTSGSNILLYDKEGHVSSFNTTTSETEWIARCDSEPYQLAVGHGILCVLTKSGCLYGISEKSGNVIWEKQQEETLGVFMALDKAVVTTRKGIFSYWAATGKSYWKNDIKCVTNSSFANGDIIYQTVNSIGILGKPANPVVELEHYAIDAGFIGLGENKHLETIITVNENIGSNFSVSCEKELVELEFRPHYDRFSTKITLNINIKAPNQPDTVDTEIVFSCQFGSYKIPVHFYSAKSKQAFWPMFKGTKDRKSESQAETGIEKSKLFWSYQGGSAAESSCAIYEGKVYVGFFDGKMICLELETGKKLWEFQAKSSIYSSPLAFCGRIYFGSWDRSIYCLDARTGQLLW